MYNLAKTIDSSVAKDQSSYFPVASLNRLGTAQTIQFQTGTPFVKLEGWHWGSKCTALSVCDPANMPANNSLAEMPRSYHTGNNVYGDYYNWYAATAGSGTYNTSTENASDSVCPKGWKMPDAETGNDGWYKLLITSYRYEDTYSDPIYHYPLNLANVGYYHLQTDGPHSVGGNVTFWTTKGSVGNARISWFNRGYMYFDQSEAKSHGFSVRCIKR